MEEDFFLCFSPERVDPGRTDWTTINTPKVIASGKAGSMAFLVLEYLAQGPANNNFWQSFGEALAADGRSSFWASRSESASSSLP